MFSTLFEEIRMAQPIISPDAMRAAADEASALLRALGNKDRLLLLCQLSTGEACVSDLEEKCAVYQPSLSQQLGVLRREGLVDTRREGKHIYYRVNNEDALAVLQLLNKRFCVS